LSHYKHHLSDLSRKIAVISSFDATRVVIFFFTRKIKVKMIFELRVVYNAQ
jgi:hypothetical protein